MITTTFQEPFTKPKVTLGIAADDTNKNNIENNSSIVKRAPILVPFLFALIIIVSIERNRKYGLITIGFFPNVLD